MSSYPLPIGYNSLVLYNSSPLLCVSSDLVEDENRIESHAPFTQYPIYAGGTNSVVDCSSLTGSITLEATPFLLSQLNSFVSIRDSEIPTFHLTNWFVIDEGVEGWSIDYGFINSVEISSQEGQLLKETITITAYNEGEGYSRWQPETYDSRYGIDGIVGYSVKQTENPSNQVIPFWQTSVSGLSNEVLGWSLHFDNNYITQHLCQANTQPQSPQYFYPGVCRITLTTSVLVTPGNEPPKELEDVTVNILNRSIVLPYCRHGKSAQPVGQSNTPQVWNVDYSLLGEMPDLSAFNNFSDPSGGITY